jgi:hypothetical protein
MATRYKKAAAIQDSLALRRNAYRVLLTRGRDGTLIYVPMTPELDDTWEWLSSLGIASL